MKRQNGTPSKKQAKRLMLSVIVATGMSGCASPPGGSWVDSDANAPPGAVVAATALAPSEVRKKVSVQPAGYTDGVVIAAPRGRAPSSRESSERAFTGAWQLEPPRPDLPSGVDGIPQPTGGSLPVIHGEGAKGEDNGPDGGTIERGENSEDAQASTHHLRLPSQAQLVISPGQPVEYFVSEALSRHPKILAARQRVAAATNLIPQARALPDPTFNNTFWPFQDHALQTAAGRVGNQMSFNQNIPFPKKLEAKAVIASREVQIAQSEVDAIAREITESVRLAYYEVWFATRAITIIEETKELVTDLTNVAEARYRSGGSQQDVLRARIESDRLDEQLITLRKQKQVAQADLATLLQQPVHLLPETLEQLGSTDPPQQIESLIALAEECNPSLRGLAWEVQRDRGKERLACLQQYPDFNVGVHWGLISDGDNVISPVANGHDNVSISFGTTLPIWRDKINAGIREAAHRRSSTTRRLEAERDELYGRLRRLIAQADALVEQRKVYEDRIIPRTEDLLKLSIADYRGKRTDFSTLIETYRELLMFETQLARIDASLAGTIAQLDRSVGCPQ